MSGYIMEYFTAVKKKKKKKKEPLPFATARMDLDSIMLSKMSQSVKDKYHLIYFYVESNKQNKLMNKIETEAWIHGTY